MTTIRQQLTRKLLMGVSGLLTIGAITTYLTTRSALTRQFDHALHSKIGALSSVVELEGEKIGMDSTDDILREFEGRKAGVFYEVWQEGGSVAETSPSLNGCSLPRPDNISEVPTYWDITLTNGLLIRATGLRFKPHPANDDTNQPASITAILVVAADRQELDHSLATLALVLVGTGVLVLTLTSILVPAVLRHELAPLGELAAQAQRIEAESLSGRFTTSGLPGELVPISSRLNDLLQRLQKSFDRERQFSDDLAHEFRTPIAELRSLAEFSLKWPENRDEEMDKNVLTIALQMENIITSLLAIARGSMGAVTIAAMPVELGELVSSVCAAFQSRAETRGLKFHVVLPSNFKIHTDPTLFRSIVTNLLDNAVEYSQSGSVIKIKGESLDGRFGLGIGNKAERLESSDLPHLFDRFWRKDTARSGGEHSGLGLTLVQAFATSLGYSLKASLDEPGELTMYLSGLVDLPIHGKTISTEQKK